MFAHRKYTLVVADANNDDSDADSSPSMTPCPSPAPPPSVHSPAPLLFNRRRLPRPPPPPTNNGDTTGLPPVLFSSLSASILQDRRQAATGAAAVAAGPLSSSSSSLVSAAAANNERAALERTVRQRISGRQRHPAGDSRRRPGVADSAPLMEPLVVDPAAVLEEEDRFLEAAVPGGRNGGEEKTAVPGGGNGVDEAPLRPWCHVRGGERRLGQRLEVMSRAAERRPKAVDGGSPLVQGLKDFFSKMFAGR
jgi:hypothetical protein